MTPECVRIGTAARAELLIFDAVCAAEISHLGHLTLADAEGRPVAFFAPGEWFSAWHGDDKAAAG